MSGSSRILALRRLFPIALWAGGHAEASVLEAFSPEEILHGCRLHKITGVAHDRMTQMLQSGSTQTLAHLRQIEQDLRDEQETMRRDFEPKRRVLREVARCVAGRGVSVLYLKGATRHLLSGRRIDFRSGDDLDLLVSDEDACLTSLSALGARTYRTTSDHEFANIELDGVKVDFHRYYPVVAPTLRFMDSVPPHAGAVAMAEHGHRISELRFDMLNAGSVAFPEMPDHVRFAGPAAAATISAAHAYRDFFVRTSLSCRFKPLIRMGDLEEWHDFARMAGEAGIARSLALFPELATSHRWIVATRERLSRASNATSFPTAADSDMPEAMCRSVFGPILTGLDRGVTAYASQPTTGEVIAMFHAMAGWKLAVGSGPYDLRGYGADAKPLTFGKSGEKGEVRLEAVDIKRLPNAAGYLLIIGTRIAAGHGTETRLLAEWDSEAVEIAERVGDEHLQVKTSAGWSGRVSVESVTNGPSRRYRITLPLDSLQSATTTPMLVGLARQGEHQQYRQGVLASFQVGI
ncbi:hypothetical protein BRCH_00697c [Candidatus Burkholderia brachyanthoides]|nr:hypothetical protein BRCH_00697c [Candidatus Burkholderia brachyanthoides]